MSRNMFGLVCGFNAIEYPVSADNVISSSYLHTHYTNTFILSVQSMERLLEKILKGFDCQVTFWVIVTRILLPLLLLLAKIGSFSLK